MRSSSPARASRALIFLRRLRPAEPQLEDPLHRRRHLFCVCLIGARSRFCSSFSMVQSCCCNHASSFAIWLMPVTAPPVSSSKLGIDLRCRCLGNPAGSLGNVAVNTEAALVDLAGQQPDRLLRRRQRRQSAMRFALDLNVLFVIFPPAFEPFRIVEVVDTSRGFRPYAAYAAWTFACIKRSPALSLRFSSSSASASRSSRAGNPSTSAAAWCNDAARAGSAENRNGVRGCAAQRRFRKGRCERPRSRLDC